LTLCAGAAHDDPVSRESFQAFAHAMIGFVARRQGGSSRDGKWKT
jgi:hypothetical protein